MKHKKPAAVLAVVGALAIAPTANAADQVVTGTTLGNSVSLGTISAATFGVALGGTGTVDDTGVGAVPVVAVGGWTMTADGGGVDAAKGKLALVGGQATCASSSATLTNPLAVYPTALLGNFTAGTYNENPISSSNPAPLTASRALGTGTGSNTITIRYKQTMDAADQLQPGCAYSHTTTVTIAGS